MTLKVLELFGGIGAPRAALERLGVDFEIVDYVEIDKFAVNSYNAIYNESYDPQDITEWDKEIDVDMIFHGSPCQDFSLAGNQAGGEEGTETRSSLMWHTVRIVDKLKPKYVIWENVKNVLSKRHKPTFDKYIDKMTELGYSSYYEVLNSKDFGVPQNRERVFVISILDRHTLYMFPQHYKLEKRLKDVLESEVDEKYYLSEKMERYIMGNAVNPNLKDQINRGNMSLNKEVAYTINTTQSRRVGATNYITDDLKERTVNDYLKIRNATKKGYVEAGDGDGVDLAYPTSKTRRGRVQKGISHTLTTDDSKATVVTDSALRIRKLTPKECWRLMDFDDE